MPALNGQIVSTLRDGNGNTVIQFTISYDPATNVLRDVVVPTTDGPESGALVIDNQTNRPVKLALANAAGQVLRTINVSRNGEAYTAGQLAALGLVTQTDLNGLTFDLA